MRWRDGERESLHEKMGAAVPDLQLASLMGSRNTVAIIGEH